MGGAADAGEEAIDAAFAVGGEAVGGGEALAATAGTEGNEMRVDNGADEGDAVVGGLAEALLWMEGEAEVFFEEVVDDVDIAEELLALGIGDDNEEVVDVAAVVRIAEVEDDEAVELVEEDIGEELASKVADNNAAALRLVEKALRGRKNFPIFAGAAKGDVAHGVVVDDLVPEKLHGLVKLFAVVGVTVDMVLRVFGMSELLAEAPEDAFIEKVVAHVHEVALDVELNAESRLGIVLGSAGDVGGEALLGIEGALADTAGIGIGDEMAVPPIAASIKDEMVDDAVTERSGDDFADDGVVDDKGDAAARAIGAVEDFVAKDVEVFHIAEFETVFVDGAALAFAGVLVGDPEFVEKIFRKATIMHSGVLLRSD